MCDSVLEFKMLSVTMNYAMSYPFIRYLMQLKKLFIMLVAEKQ